VYDVEADLRPGGEQHTALRDTAAQEAAIKAPLDERW
jgi:hypothetical protein